MILLASRSPQRRALLASLGVPYRIVASSYGEDDLALPPVETAREHALAKARDVAARSGIPEGGAVLGADTVVILGGEALGKPAGPDDAAAMITALAGREHVVATGVALLTGTGEDVRDAQTRVRFRPLQPAEVDWYVATGEWRDRAGGYAIQGAGAALVDGIDGDHANVIGLPVSLLARMLAQAGLAPWTPRRP
ncbi:MAG: Maf family protein [Actinomycetota bacterium]